MRSSIVRQVGGWGRRAASILAISLLAQCTLGGPDSIDPDRPYPQAKASTSTPQSGPSGLRIFTESYLFGLSQDVDKVKMRYYTGYTLYDQSGRRLSHVPEQAYEPRRQPLTPGRYLILLDRPGPHPPVFWVTVQAGQNTDVQLPELPPRVEQP